MRIDRRAFLALLLVPLLLGPLVAGGCGDGPGSNGTITLGAAASLRRVLPELIETYRADHPDAFVVHWMGRPKPWELAA